MVLGNKKEKINHIYVALVVLICLSVFLAGCSKSIEVKEPNMDVKDTKSEIEQNQELITNFIADGTYTNDVTYNYHSGQETINIDITVKDDVVTAASVESVGETHKTSQKYIDGVNAALPELVIGKKINEINLPKQISGSSLTTAALKDHLQELVETY